MKRLAFLCLVLAGCDALPRDPDGTLDRITASRRLVVGFAAPPTPKAEKLVEEIARKTGAAVTQRRGSLEPLIADLDAGRVDLVLTELSQRSPWKTLVAPGPALATRAAGDEQIELRALMKNGENRWIVLVERASRTIAPDTAQ